MKDKEKYNKYQLELYHKNKDNPNSSCFIENRRLQQKKDYHNRHPNAKYYNSKSSNINYVKDLKINKGNFIINFN